MLNSPSEPMTLTQRNPAPSAAIVAIIDKKLKSLMPDLQSDEVRVRLARSLTESPPFSVATL